MGVIDKATYTLTCPECGEAESASVTDKGSGWGGSYWGESAHFMKFETTWTGGQKIEPTLQSAICKKCGATAENESKYTS